MTIPDQPSWAAAIAVTVIGALLSAVLTAAGAVVLRSDSQDAVAAERLAAVQKAVERMEKQVTKMTDTSAAHNKNTDDKIAALDKRISVLEAKQCPRP